MIRQISRKEYNLIKEFIQEDIGRNYFILLGLSSEKTPYDKIYGEFQNDELVAVLFRRHSGTLQFYALESFDVDSFIELISTMDYNSLISPRSFSDRFLEKGIFFSAKDGAYISKLAHNQKLKIKDNEYSVRNIKTQDLDEIVNLYKGCFQSFSPKEVMAEKLEENRGRGVCIEENGEIISVAQTDFETEDAALIVGVATKREYRGRGLATLCLKSLILDLQEEKKDLYLQYDNLDAGKIYERLGFRIIDQVRHYKKKHQ